MSGCDDAERARLRTNRDRVEALMRDGDWHTSLELIEVGGIRAVGRLFDLKAHGYDYDKRRRSAGVFEYRLRRLTTEQLSLL